MSLMHQSLTDDVMFERDRVIKEALSWIGTPYFWLADRKGVGVDCAMLLVRAFVDTGVLAPLDPRPYSPTWHMHHSEEKYLSWLENVATEKDDSQLTPGDVIVWRFGRCYSHGAIFLGGESIVHALVMNGKVMRGKMSETDLRRRPLKVYDIWLKKRQAA